MKRVKWGKKVDAIDLLAMLCFLLCKIIIFCNFEIMYWNVIWNLIFVVNEKTN